MPLTAKKTTLPATLISKILTPEILASTDPEVPLAPDLIREAGRYDLEFFARAFFPEFCRLPFSAMHKHLFERRQQKLVASLDDLPARRGELDVVLAPRGAAKSTLVSLIFPAHALLYRNEAYIVLISATQRQAGQRLASLKGALLKNPLIRQCFPEAIESLASASARSLELGGARIDAFSAGAEMRGIGFGPWRPSWIILDDVERSDRVQNAEQREKLADWFDEVVGNLGDRYTHLDLVGTLLHRDALPARLKKRPGVRYECYRSIIREADAAELWEAWRGYYRDLADPERERTAAAFLEERRPAMLAGAEVLWPAKEDLPALSIQRETVGRAAFDKEKQNAPWADGTAVFAASPLRRFRQGAGRLVCDAPFAPPGTVTALEAAPPEVELAGLRIFGFLDPALGGPGGDYAAIATVGRDPAGYLYLLDVWLERAGPSVQIQRIFDLHERWGYERFGIETNAFQKLLLDPFEAERTRRRQQGRRWDLDVVPVRPEADKRTRILSLEPPARNGWLLLAQELPAEFMSQLLDFPTAAHDDGPDAVAGAVELARKAGTLELLPARRPRAPAGALGNY